MTKRHPDREGKIRQSICQVASRRITQEAVPLTLARFCTIVDLQLGYFKRGDE